MGKADTGVKGKLKPDRIPKVKWDVSRDGVMVKLSNLILYDSILKDERRKAESFKENLLQKTRAALMKHTTIEGMVKESQIILNSAYIIGDSKVSKPDINSIVDKLCYTDSQTFERVLTVPQFLDAQKDWVKARVKFYQQIVQFSGRGSTHSLGEVVDKLFKTESREESRASYRKALQPIAKAEIKMYSVLEKDSRDVIHHAVTQAQEDIIDYSLPYKNSRCRLSYN